MEEIKNTPQIDEGILKAMESEAEEIRNAVLDGQCVAVPIVVFEELIRAETERDIYEAALGSDKYSGDTIRDAICEARKARESRGFIIKDAIDSDEGDEELL